MGTKIKFLYRNVIWSELFFFLSNYGIVIMSTDNFLLYQILDEVSQAYVMLIHKFIASVDWINIILPIFALYL